MIQRKEFLNDWFFNLNYVAGMESSTNTKGFESVLLPHSNVELPYHYFDEKVYQVVSCYKRFFLTPVFSPGQIIKLRFEGVMAYAKVYLNGQLLGEHKGGYTPFEFEVQDLLQPDAQNDLTVVADASEREEIPPFGGQIDYLTYGGIYREVSLDFYQPVYIRNARITTTNVLSAKPGLTMNLWIENTLADRAATVIATLNNQKGQKIYQESFDLQCASGSSTVTLTATDLMAAAAESIRLWTFDDPALYTLKLTLQAGVAHDIFETRIGFRTAEFKTEGFFLNGERVQIRGLNRHQSWPYVGYAMPKRVQIKDADILKYDLNLNLVRTSHYPQSIHFLDRCDEIGLLVFEEIPGWQHIGPEDWKMIARENVREMIERDWNHPSIIIWGVRINESADDHDFYTATNQIARSLDPSRQTGGVRCIENSELLEDVYTMNDFVNNGQGIALRDTRQITGLNHLVPYLITEYNGHMFPTKKFDNEERQLENVIRHLQIQNAAYENPWISGAIGWCAFDYNTHKDFGSGDRICYHGVMDMFRIKKFSAYVYKSQVSPAVEPVIMPVTYWARGERSVGGILPLYVLTNCDAIEIQFGSYPPIAVTQKSELYKNLPYPPFVIDTDTISPSQLGEWGMRWEDGIVSGFVGGQKVAEVQMAKDPIFVSLSVTQDDTELTQGQKDATRIQISVLDQMGNVLPFATPVVRVTVSGPGRIQGPSSFALTGGTFGFYVESNGQKGTLDIKVESDGFIDQKLKITVV